MPNVEIEKVTLARNQIGPLLDRLIVELEAEGCATQRAYFNRIRHHLSVAHDDWELTTPIIELTSSPAIGFQLSSTAAAILSRILKKASHIVEDLEGVAPEVH